MLAIRDDDGVTQGLQGIRNPAHFDAVRLIGDKPHQARMILVQSIRAPQDNPRDRSRILQQEPLQETKTSRLPQTQMCQVVVEDAEFLFHPRQYLFEIGLQFVPGFVDGVCHAR